MKTLTLKTKLKIAMLSVVTFIGAVIVMAAVFLLVANILANYFNIWIL